MKKLMTLMLGMALAFTTVAVTFAQDAPKKDETTKKKDTTKKKGKKKDDAPTRRAHKRSSEFFRCLKPRGRCRAAFWLFLSLARFPLFLL